MDPSRITKLRELLDQIDELTTRIDGCKWCTDRLVENEVDTGVCHWARVRVGAGSGEALVEIKIDRELLFSLASVVQQQTEKLINDQRALELQIK